jgi:hypothetical protein
MPVKVFTDIFKPWTTTLITMEALSRIVLAMELVIKSVVGNRGHGEINIVISEGKVTEVKTMIRERIAD